MRYLINNNGVPFESTEIKTLHNELDALGENERTEYRNQNALAIAHHSAIKFLIVSGPGTGKSHLFLDRIKYWENQDEQAKVFVTSFVRKLVADLQSDISNDIQLSAQQRKNITVSTLHKFARSIIEKNHGTATWQFQPHIRIIGQFWKGIVWEDSIAFYPSLNLNDYPWKKFEEQLHNAEFKQSNEWKNLKEVYFKLCKFYNAVGFPDLILRAKDALSENPRLNENNYFIIDEFQDFNLAENALINQLVNDPKGLLVVGDDDQVLYEDLKSSKRTLIRDLYHNHDYMKGMLPFCGRSSYHITKTAEHFIQQQREINSIEKIYLPIKSGDNNIKVEVIACATSQTAVDYIENFVQDNKISIDERRISLAEGREKDAFLLILSPTREVKFYRESKVKIDNIVAEYQTEIRNFSEDYYKLLSYYSLANYSQNNFTFRKILYYENIEDEKVHELIELSLENHKNLCDFDSEEIKNIIQKCSEIRSTLDANDLSIDDKIENITHYINIIDKDKLKKEMERNSINQDIVVEIEHQDEEEAELEEIEVKKMGAVEMMTIVGSKGLSADHVIIIGFDNVNMGRVTKNAFYVAITRARKSLQILTALKSGGAKQAHNFIDQLSNDDVEYYSYTKSNRTKKRLQGKTEFKKYLYNLNSYHR